MIQKHIFTALLLSCFINIKAQVTSEEIATYKNFITTPVDSLERLAQIYPKTVDQIEKWTELAIALAQQEIDQIITTENKTFENTIQALDISSSKLSSLHALFGMLKYVHPDHEIRTALQKAIEILMNAEVDFSMNSQLYQAVQTYANQNHEQQYLDEQDQRLLKNLLEGFKSQGLHLPEETQIKIKELSKELAAIRQDFSNNINNSNPKMSVSLQDLDGLSDDYIQSLPKDGDLYILGCDVATYIKILEECNVEKTRKDLYFLRNNTAYPENDVLLTKLLEKQDELAQLLGDSNYATYDLKQTTAKTIENVQNFEYNILHTALVKAKSEIDLIKTDLPKNIASNLDGTLKPWDYAYATNAFKKKHFAIDEAKIAEYFPTDKVIDGIFEIYQKFLKLTFKKVTPLWSWHEDVQLIEVYRTSTNELLGYIFLDLYPRDNKYGHACCYPQVSSYFSNNQNRPSVATLICNFPKPYGNVPGLLKHTDVVTFFHEFGHAMHNVLSITKHIGQSGLSVAKDFVEVPSQMFEQWMYEPEMLKLVSAHYKTGESLPEEIIEQKIKLRNFNSGFIIARQCMLGLFSLQLMTKNELSYNPSTLWKKLYEQYWNNLINYEENNHWYTTFGHLKSTLYGPKYFCYLWTEVIALDLFAHIKSHNFNTEYQDKIIALLSAGDSVDCTTLVHNVLDRDVDQEAFFKILGLK